MSSIKEPPAIRRWTTELERLRARAARLARRMPLDDAGAVELLEACLGLGESILRDLSGAALGSDSLRKKLENQQRWWTGVFDDMPTACLEIDAQGEIVRANRAAALLLNTSAKHLQGREILPFVQDRDRFAGLLRQVTFEPGAHRAALVIRPRERASVEAAITVLNVPEDGSPRFLWFLAPTPISSGPVVKPMVRSNGEALDGRADVRRSA